MPPPKERQTIQVQAERAILAAVRLPDSNYDQADPFGELKALAEQAGATVVGELEQRRQKPESGTYIGTGKLEELKAMCEALGATVVIFDHDLAPKQIANIEAAVERKIIDRSELILDIFASRATTHEAKLAVELAQLQYTYPRLRAMWSHLERITGSGGMAGIGTRGPGEMQLEIDRRLAQRRRLMLESELNDIHARKRQMVRKRKRDHYTVGIVGYTNAGKSTLFNALTEGGAYADDRLFATLVTRTRDWNLEGGVKVMLSDTVGFVRDLPHHLIASFRATLEEATHADLLLIVLDVSDPAAELQFNTVMQTLDELEEETREEEDRAVRKGTGEAYSEFAAGRWQRSADEDDDGEWEDEPRPRTPRPPKDADDHSGPLRLVLLNKVDRLKDNRQLLVWQRKAPGAIVISAKDGPGGRGFAELTDRVRNLAQQGVIDAEVTIPSSDGKTLQRLETRGQVRSRDFLDDVVKITVRIGRRQLDEVLTGARGVQVRELPPGSLVSDGNGIETE